MNYQGDILLGDTIDVKFTTVSTTGVPTTLAGSPVVSAYVGNGTTEITAGITLTVDFDSRTGMHNVRVVASSGNGFATANNVDLVITAGTVGGNSVVGYVIGNFSIENRSAARVGAAMTLTSAYDPAKTAATQASVNIIDDFVDTEVGSIKTVTDKLDTALVADGGVWQYTANALELGPAGGGGGGDASQATLLAVKAKTDNLPTDPADASDIATSFSTVNTKLDAIDDFVDTEINAIKTKTDALPADPASASGINSQFSVTNGKIDVVDDYIDTELAAVKAKTDQLVFTGGKVDANATLTIAAGDLTAIADSILKRDWTSVSGEAVYSLLNAARMLRNAWSTASGVLIVKKEDGSTTAWSRPLSTDASAEPITGAS